MNYKMPIIQFKDLLEQHKATVYDMANEIRSIDPSRPVIPAISNNPPTVYDLVATVFAAGYAAGVENGTQHRLVDAYAHLTICTRCGQIHDNRVDCHPGWLASKRINDALEPKSIDETACPRCGSVSSRPNGEHYCHQRTNDARLQALKAESDLRAMMTTQPLVLSEPERDDPHEDLGYKGRGR